MELTTLTKISQIRQSKLTIFMQIISPDGGDFYANYIMSYPSEADDFD